MTPQTNSSGSGPATQQNGYHNDDVDERTALERLVEVATVVLTQAIDLVDNSLTSDEQMTARSQYIPGSTIGKHLRHARDHYMLLVDAMSSDAPHTLNYDIRARNTPMESSRVAASQGLTDTITCLENLLPKAKMDEPITLHAITPYAQTMQTTFGRELWFGSLHTVHHWSMVRVIAGELGITLEDSFGFAPSTLVHKGSEAPLGKSRI